MPTFTARQIESLLVDIFVAVETPMDIARYISASLVEASLKGVDSHGVMRVSLYVDQILSGDIKPAARPQILKETPTTAFVSSNWGFGICALGFAMDTAIKKAKSSQVAIVGLTDSTHTGRLGQFAEMAAKENMIAIITGGGRRAGPGVSMAPFGGARPIFATNPWALGMPGGQFGPVVADFATSTVAEGKLQVYRQKHEVLPQGWIVDKNGNPSIDVEDFYDGGMLLPAAGHKGYSLALAAEFLTAFLLGEPRHPTYWLHWCIIAIDVQTFRPLDTYQQDVETFLRKVKDVPPANGFDEVLIPGEPENRTAQQRNSNGIPIPIETWKTIEKTARQVGVNPDLSLSLPDGKP